MGAVQTQSEHRAPATGGRPGAFRRWRDGVRNTPGLHRVYRIVVGVVGALVVAVGVVLIPYPGPGWLIVLAGLAILASEFDRAQRALHFVKFYYDSWTRWLGRQHLLVKGAVGLLTVAVVLLTLWLLGTVGMVAGWIGLTTSWADSPILR